METVKYEIREDTFADKIDGLYHLFKPHWEEVAKNKELMVLKGDNETYKKLEAAGCLASLFAYAGNEIVGYSVNIISNHLHYVDLKFAQNDILFVLPEYRNSPLGTRLIRKTEELCRSKGALILNWHAKDKTTLFQILPRMGYDIHETIFSKKL